MNNELNFPPNFERLVLGCIDADFRKQILFGIRIYLKRRLRRRGHVGKLSPRSTRFTFMRLLEKRTEVENEKMKMNHTEKAMHTLLHILNPIEKP